MTPSRRHRALLLAALAALAAPLPGSAQQPRAGNPPAASDSARSPAADPIRVWLATYGPGAAVWEKFGHNAIWVHDARSGITTSYNWGMFSFDQPGFVPRLIRGSMLYWMMPQDAALEAEGYIASGRAIRLQELHLSPAAKLELNEFLHWNARPENRFYEYDYFRDNCSTRVRDAIDRATGGALEAALTRQPTPHTWRSESLRLTAAAPAVFTGLELGMADPVDQPLTQWQLGFIPMRLADAVATLDVTDASGATVPLVQSDTVLFAGAGFGAEQAPDRALLYLLAGLLIGAAFVLSATIAERGGAARLPFAVLAGSWSLVVGFFGLLLALLWGLTGHVVTYGNENLLQANPLSLGLVVLAPLAAFRRGGSRAALALAALIAALSVFGFAAQIFPTFDQYNRHVIALLLPAHLGVLWGVYRLLDGGSSARRDAFRGPGSGSD